MISHANIPLATPSKTRQLPWRVLWTFALFFVSMYSGFTFATWVHEGFYLARAEGSSGVSARLTPTTKLWIAEHLGGYIIDSSCAFNLPHLLSKSSASRIVVSSENNNMNVSLEHTKEIPCTTTPQNDSWSSLGNTSLVHIENSFSLPKRTPWLWDAQGNTLPLTLLREGVSFTTPELSKRHMLAPATYLNEALPFSQNISLPSLQFMTPRLMKDHEGMMFSWRTSEGDLAYGYTFSPPLEEHEATGVCYELLGAQKEASTFTRTDGGSFFATTYEDLSFLQPFSKEQPTSLYGADGKPACFLSYQEGMTTISSSEISWSVQSARWQGALKQSNTLLSPQTLSNYGSTFLRTKKSIKILE